MNVLRARKAGFCMGVSLALRKLDALLAAPSGPAIHMLGPIIHNPQVLAAYAARGVLLAEGPEDVPAGARVIVRAHGIPRRDEEALAARGVRVIDATCPKVKKAQLLIAEQCETGAGLLLYGEENHPEVKGLLSYAREDALVFDEPGDLESFRPEPGRKYFLAAQTTQDRRVFEETAAALSERLGPEFKVLPTICDATKERQEAAIRTAGQVEVMVVVGGRTSGNTRRLAQVVEAAGTPCVLVETVDELPVDRLVLASAVGLTAGASTPAQIIDAVEERLAAL